MAVFKIKKGKNADLSKQTKTAGTLYFTEDTGDLYADFSNTQRTRLTRRAAQDTLTVDSSGWTSVTSSGETYFTSTINLSRSQAEYVVQIDAANGLTTEEYNILFYARISVLSSTDSTITLKAQRKPSLATKLVLTYIPKEQN